MNPYEPPHELGKPEQDWLPPLARWACWAMGHAYCFLSGWLFREYCRGYAEPVLHWSVIFAVLGAVAIATAYARPKDA